MNLRYLSFEINDDCQLTKVHGECPRNKRVLQGAPLTVDNMVGFLEHCITKGFNGMVNFHYYNEPLISRYKIVEIMDRVKARYSLWTNGILLTPEDGEFLSGFEDVMVTVYPETNRDVIRYLMPIVPQMRVQLGRLDDRIKEGNGVPISRCDRPNWELIVDNSGKGHVCCGDWNAEMEIGDIRDGYDTFLDNWNGWRERLLSGDFPHICRVCYERAPHTSRL